MSLQFFKDRHYLEKDWGKYFSDDDTASVEDDKVVLEVLWWLNCHCTIIVFVAVTGHCSIDKLILEFKLFGENDRWVVELGIQFFPLFVHTLNFLFMPVISPRRLLVLLRFVIRNFG